MTLFNSLKACHPPDSSHVSPVSENANHGVDCDAACSLQDGQQLALLLHRAGLNEDDADNARQPSVVQPNAAATAESSAQVSTNDGAASTSLHAHAGPVLTSEVLEGDRNCIRSWMQVSRHTLLKFRIVFRVFAYLLSATEHRQSIYGTWSQAIEGSTSTQRTVYSVSKQSLQALPPHT